MKTYYHILEDDGHGGIGSHGFRETLAEAETEVQRLSNFFPDLYFYVLPSNSKREPEIVTI